MWYSAIDNEILGGLRNVVVGLTYTHVTCTKICIEVAAGYCNT